MHECLTASLHDLATDREPCDYVASGFSGSVFFLKPRTERHIMGWTTYHPDIEQFVWDQIRADGYRSPDEVVTEALFLLWQRDQANEGGPAATSPDGRH